MNRYKLNIVLLSFFIVSCGSLPSKKDFYYYDLKEAEEITESGDLLLSKNHLDAALYNYLEAYKKYTLLDYRKGKFTSSVKIAGVYIKLGEMENAFKWLQKSKLNFEGDIYSSSEYLLLTAEYNLNKNDFNEIVRITEKEWIHILNPETQLELTAYRIFSLIQLSKDYSDEFLFLSSHLNGKREKIFNINPLALSFLYYTMGYVSSRESDWESGIKYFNYSLDIDKSNSNYNGIADNLYAIGVAEKNLNRFVDAKKSLMSAFEIYNYLNDEHNSELAETELLVLKYLSESSINETEKRLLELYSTSLNENLKNKIREILKIVD